jgi:hypothetical protein
MGRCAPGIVTGRLAVHIFAAVSSSLSHLFSFQFSDQVSLNQR